MFDILQLWRSMLNTVVGQTATRRRHSPRFICSTAQMRGTWWTTRQSLCWSRFETHKLSLNRSREMSQSNLELVVWPKQLDQRWLAVVIQNINDWEKIANFQWHLSSLLTIYISGWSIHFSWGTSENKCFVQLRLHCGVQATLSPYLSLGSFS